MTEKREKADYPQPKVWLRRGKQIASETATTPES